MRSFGGRGDHPPPRPNVERRAVPVNRETERRLEEIDHEGAEGRTEGRGARLGLL